MKYYKDVQLLNIHQNLHQEMNEACLFFHFYNIPEKKNNELESTYTMKLTHNINLVSSQFFVKGKKLENSIYRKV